MIRRFLYCVAIVAFTGAGALLAAERATFILTDGERMSGTIVSPNGNFRDRDNRGRGDLSLLTDDGREIPIRLDQVAVIQFGGGRPSPAELDALPQDESQLIVLNNGSVEAGRFINFSNGDAIQWQARNGRQQTIPFRSLTRVYLNTDRARTAFNNGDRSNRGFRDRDDRRFGDRDDRGFGGRNEPGFRNDDRRGVGTAGRATNGRDVRVNANQAWTDTGVDVRAGDLVIFRASGQINFGTGQTQTAGPDGNPSLKRAEYPASGMPVGALIGRVNGSAPFVVGANAQPIRMPANGSLMLGVNDNELVDNSGFFTVAIERQ